MTIIMSDTCSMHVFWEDNWQLIDDSTSPTDNSRVMLQLAASFTIVIYDCHIFIVHATGVFDSGERFQSCLIIMSKTRRLLHSGNLTYYKFLQ